MKKIFYFFILVGINGYAQKGNEAIKDTSPCEQVIISGQYDQGILLLSYDSLNKKISGIVEEEMGDPIIKCSFFFWGKLNNKKPCDEIMIYAVPEGMSYDENPAEGRMYLIGRDIKLQFTNPLGPCFRIQELLEGQVYGFDSPVSYNPFGSIRAMRAYLYKEPLNQFKQKSYLIQDDRVSVLKRKGNWLYIEYVKNPKVKGWIKKSVVWGED